MYKNMKRLSKVDYEYMNSLSEAVLLVRPKRLHILLWIVFFTIVVFIFWASFAYIDEIARGSGEVIPSGDNQIVQNLEGGIVESILVHDGEKVKKNQILLKITNKKSESIFESNYLKRMALDIQIRRLKAQIAGKEFIIDGYNDKNLQELYKNEKSLFISNLQQVQAKKSILKNQLTQKVNELKDAKMQEKLAKNSLTLIEEELFATIPMVKKGLSSNMDLLALKRERNSIKQKYTTARLSIPKIEAQIAEIKNKIDEVDYIFQSNSKEQLAKAIADFKELEVSKKTLKDQVFRTDVRAPMDGIVQKLYVNTVGGVIKPAQDLVELVPLNEQLIVEVKIKPSDIAFIYEGIDAIVKVSSFDFSIYGGLKGKVVQISPDTIKDKDGNQFYLVKIKTDKNSFEHNGKKIKILPGMTVSVDILTGKKTVMQYILKPIIKAKEYAFTQR